MIVFIISAAHAYAHRALVGRHTGTTVNLLTYEDLARLRQVPRATYVFTDLDRIPTETLREAGEVCLRMRRHGLGVLNDPARVLSRYGLLRALYRRGFNRFNAYRAEEAATPERWPVFLRTDGDHLGPLPELYASPEALRQGIERALARGLPMSRLLIVEYCAEPVLPRLYRKFSVFRVGKACVAHTCVDDTQWIAKFGQRGISPPEFFEQEFAIVRDNPYGAAVWDAFDVAGMEYGRADFGLVEGRPQVYEINSNPHVVLEDDNPNLARRRTSALFAANYGAALRTIDTPDSNTLVTIAAPALRKH